MSQINESLLSWAVQQWHEEVFHRPVVNVHRRTLDDTWRQVIRFAGGDPDKLLDLPAHDQMRGAMTESEYTAAKDHHLQPVASHVPSAWDEKALNVARRIQALNPSDPRWGSQIHVMVLDAMKFAAAQGVKVP